MPPRARPVQVDGLRRALRRRARVPEAHRVRARPGRQEHGPGARADADRVPARAPAPEGERQTV